MQTIVDTSTYKAKQISQFWPTVDIASITKQSSLMIGYYHIKDLKINVNVYKQDLS